MKRVSCLLLGVAVLTACAAPLPPRVVERLPETPAAPPLPPLGKEELVRLAKEGVAAEGIIGRIKESRTRLRLSASDVLSLKTQGVPLAVLDHLLDGDRLATADECTAQINRRDEEARATLQQAVQHAELMGWQRCNLMTPFPGWHPFPYRR